MSSHGKLALVGLLVLAGSARVGAQTAEVQKITELELQVKKLTAQAEDLKSLPCSGRNALRSCAQ